MTYETEYKGSPVVASGMVYMPVEGTNFSFLSFAHGTVANNSAVPSQLSIGDVQGLLYAGMASTGMITAAPDFIGFGSSIEIMHPYYVEEPIALAVIDQLRAVRELASQESVSPDNQLYLSGYSQGGYVAMAAHKFIEEQGLEYFDLQASFPSSGGYDIKGVRDFMLEQEIYDNPFFMAYVEEAYRTYYDWNAEIASLFFNEPYNQIVIDVFDGVNSGGDINDLLNDTISVLMTPGFIENPDGSDFTEIAQKFDENSLLDWKPAKAMHMYHGDADITVPYHTSIDTYEQFIESGVSSDLVTMTTMVGATHYTGFIPYLEHFFAKVIDMEGR
jgi:pimeloyl-ACP methyl ester carboxylesterase